MLQLLGALAQLQQNPVSYRVGDQLGIEPRKRKKKRKKYFNARQAMDACHIHCTVMERTGPESPGYKD